MRSRDLVALLGIASAGSALPASSDAQPDGGAQQDAAAAARRAVSPAMDAAGAIAQTRYPFLCDYLAAVPDCYCNCLLLACIQTFTHISDCRDVPPKGYKGESAYDAWQKCLDDPGNKCRNGGNNSPSGSTGHSPPSPWGPPMSFPSSFPPPAFPTPWYPPVSWPSSWPTSFPFPTNPFPGLPSASSSCSESAKPVPTQTFSFKPFPHPWVPSSSSSSAGASRSTTMQTVHTPAAAAASSSNQTDTSTPTTPLTTTSISSSSSSSTSSHSTKPHYYLNPWP